MNAGEDPSSIDRLMDLVVEQTTCGLNLADQDDLSSLMSQLQVTRSEIQLEAEQLELAFAAADLASFRHQTEPLPGNLRDKLLMQAGQFFSAKSKSMELPDQAVNEKSLRLPETPKVERRPLAASPPSWREMLSILAAAACILLLLANWEKIVSPSVAQLEAKFLESKPSDLIDTQFTAGSDPNGASVSGRLTWSTKQQQGFMNIRGMKINDPSVEQYQLWIFESADQEQPIDGGVFDISDEETKIQIDPKIKVDQGVFFAITVEKPGGVVVSDRKRIAAAATPK